MLAWNSREVSAFLATEPEKPHHEDTEFRFRFPVREAYAELCVFPFDERVTLTLWTQKKEEQLAYWAFDSDQLTFQDEIEEEGGPSLAIVSLQGRGQQNVWLSIGKDGDAFSIYAASVRPSRK
ncbi:MAG TPA: hypothetical protein VG734_09695 [Lacunisphaera sp.]|nr:hypothetical protein [Lacunisphaera sp.]